MFVVDLLSVHLVRDVQNHIKKKNQLVNGCLTNQWSSAVVLNLLTIRPIAFEGS